mgnify:CR=1 FL=1
MLTQTQKEGNAPSKMPIALIFFGPFVYRWLQNKTKKYMITTQRVYIEEGIISKKMNEISFDKINDLVLSQNIIQRLVGSGNILILTASGKPTVIKDIEQPHEFKSAISDMIQKKPK